jgi:flagellar motor switch protein FliN/FliY
MSGDSKAPKLDELVDEDHGDSELLPLAADQPAAPLLTSRGTTPASHLGAIAEIPVQLSAVLGKATMPVSQLLRLGRGAVVELDRRVGESIDILVNNRLVARGEVVVVDDRLGVTLTEIIKSDG